MNFSNAPADLIINLVAGIVSAIIVLITVERRRRPSLKFEIESEKVKSPNTIHLRVYVYNERTYRPLSLVYDREPALMCRAWIGFYHLDGAKVYSHDMSGRWAETPEPVKPFPVPTGEIKWIYDTSATRDFVDIAPGSQSILDIAFKFNSENECYGWNNEGYSYADRKNPQWKLDKGRYILRVKVKTGGREFIELFQLINDMDFRLESFKNKALIQSIKRDS